LLLRTIEDVPAVQVWLDRLERGDSVNPAELQQEINNHQPRELPTFRPARFAVSLFLALMLLAPILQMFVLADTAVYPSQNAALRGEARERVQLLCNTLVRQAIQERRLRETFGSCFDWSLRLPDDTMQAVVRCHARTANDEAAFRRCVLDADVFPAELVPIGDSA
jgi:hypothetical protein